ncbi:hypothetical protein C900_01280 [Fulvivirga imtechensis AK7]|uniref:Uncharacterized protein n=2 Tax=Fulvivirga TaxID=396811 RepID=L8JGQ6_9BACT|nr:hypothetical protein C900_01280 [Fulvivirga imtechensis AK7]
MQDDEFVNGGYNVFNNPGNIGGYTGPGSGHHWSDQYRSIAGNAMMMSGGTFRDFYGISNPDGSINYTRAAQVARQGGLGVRFEGTFGVIELSSGSTEINIVQKGDSYLYKLDGEFYGVGGGGKGYPVQDPYTNEYKGFKYNFDYSSDNGSGFSGKDFALALAGAGLARGNHVMFNDKTWYSVKTFKTYSQSFNGNGYTGGKVKVASKVSTGFKVGGYALGIYNAVSLWDQKNQGEIGVTEMWIEQTSNAISTFVPIYGAGWGIGWSAGKVFGPSKWYGDDDTSWFK